MTLIAIRAKVLYEDGAGWQKRRNDSGSTSQRKPLFFLGEEMTWSYESEMHLTCNVGSNYD